MAMGIILDIFKVIIILLFCICQINSLCNVQTGEAVIILDVSESKYNKSDQLTQPSILPINGNLTDIKLQIIADSENIFKLDGKQLKLRRPLDRDLKDISFIQLQIQCTIISSNAQRTIPITVRVIDINDNAPKFLGLPYETTVSELAPIGTTIYRGLQTSDEDSSVNGLVEYFVVPGNGSKVDGYKIFGIDLPYQGYVTLRQPMDYENINYYEVIISAVDHATKGNFRLSSTATLTVSVTDEDDQDPAFVYQECSSIGGSCVNPEYFTDVISDKVTGILDVKPSRITAVDRDHLNYTIIYSFTGGHPTNYSEYFEMDSNSGIVRQIKSVDRSLIKNFSIIIMAEEMSENRRFSTAKLNILVRPSRERPPVLRATSLVGFIDEQSANGTFVTTVKCGNESLRFLVEDTDLDPEDAKPNYEFELTTNKFYINKDGYLVSGDSTLDRDPPNPEKYVFQVIAREISGKMASAPLTVTVHVNDVNDNTPKIQTLMPVTVRSKEDPAPTLLTHVQARDRDVEDNSQVTFSLYHVSNDGRSKFRVNETSGAIESTGLLEPGRQYSLTVQAEDRGGRVSHRILDVYVEPTEDITRPPFTRQVYDIKVSEGITPGSAILSLNGESESNRDVTYVITEGNNKGAFLLSPLSGMLTVRQPLDREDVSHYSLIIKATDRAEHSTSATVTIEVTDINDCNPEFLGQPYVFHVDEGLVNIVIGHVQASDPDAGLNGMVRYSVSSASSIRIDSFSGEIRTNRPLDFESHPMEYAIITAHDGAADPRISTATITILVNDVPDEVPTFLRRYYDGSIPENMASMDVLQVAAFDPDGYKQVTYVMRDGPLNRFSVDPLTGVVRSIWPLDFEENNQYTLVIGTHENVYDQPDATCIVRITVLDRNDIPPLLTAVPSPIRLQDTIRIGTSIATIVALDSDGTPPNNLVRYTLGISNQEQNYFNMDHDTGVITLKGDLSKEPTSELKLEVRAYDLGSPQLTASATIAIYIEHLATPAPEMGLAFPDPSYTLEIDENALGNTIIKTLPIINKRAVSPTMSCEIERGNEQDHFYLQTSDKGDCELRTKGQKLDYESKPQYHLIIKLKTDTAAVDRSRVRTEVTVKVMDSNDNSPNFLYPSPMSKLIGKRYVASIANDAASLTPVTKISAIDHDSGEYGKLEYSIIPESDPGNFFLIDRETGLVSNSRTFEKVESNDTLFEIKIRARDNPKSTNNLNSTASLVINLISDVHRLVLVILDSPPEKVAEQKSKLTEMLQDTANLVINIEKIESRRYLNNSRVTTDPGGTDIWFNAVDPKTMQIITATDDKLNMFVKDHSLQRSVLYAMSGALEMNVDSVRAPIVIEINVQVPLLPPAHIWTEEDVDGFQAALIALACIIAVLGTVGIIYVCFIWSRFKTYRDRIQRLSLAPRYEPVLVEPNLKPYETQILEMNVQLDDSSSFEDNGSPYDFKRTMDNVSYITKDTGDGSTLALGNMSFTESDSFEGGESILLNSQHHGGGRDPVGFGITMSPAHNPVYHSSDENAGSPFEGFSLSPQPRSGRINLSPVATTTEL